MKILIVGGGKIIYFLSRSLISKGYKVTIINKNFSECTNLAKRLNAVIINGEGSDPQILENAGAFSADALLAVTTKDQDNLIICQLADKKFNIPNVIASVNDPDNENVFQQLGIKAISTTRILSTLIEQKTGFEEIINLIPLGEGKVNVTEIKLNTNSHVIGKTMQEISPPEDSLVACILRADRAIIPRGITKLKEHDKLIVMTTPENHGKVIKFFIKEKLDKSDS